MIQKVIIIITIAISIVFSKAYAYDTSALDKGKNALISEINKNIDGDFDSLYMFEELSKGNMKNVFLYIFEYVKESLSQTLVNRKNIMSTIIAILSFSVFVSLAEDRIFTKNCSVLMCAVASVSLLNFYSGLFALASQTLSSVFSVMRVSLPLFMGISAASGKPTYAAADGFFIGFSVLFGHICSFMMPVVTIAVGSAVVGSFGISCEKLGKFIFSFINWCLGICCVMFTALLKLTSVGAANFDYVMLGGVKFALSHGIPVIGGFVSDSASALISAALVIRNSLGLLTAVAIIILCAAPCIYIFSVSLLLKFLSAVCSSFSSNASCALVENIGSCISELGIILLAVCLCFIIGTAIMLSSFGV